MRVVAYLQLIAALHDLPRGLHRLALDKVGKLAGTEDTLEDPEGPGIPGLLVHIMHDEPLDDVVVKHHDNAPVSEPAVQAHAKCQGQIPLLPEAVHILVLLDRFLERCGLDNGAG